MPCKRIDGQNALSHQVTEPVDRIRSMTVEENWLVYINGEMVPMKDAKISVFDRSFQYGDGVFEGMRCYDGRIFKLGEHTERLYPFGENDWN